MRGSIVKRGVGYSYVLYLGRDASGRKRQKWVGGYRTKRAAEAAMVEALGRLRAGHFVDLGCLTAGEFLEPAPRENRDTQPTRLSLIAERRRSLIAHTARGLALEASTLAVLAWCRGTLHAPRVRKDDDSERKSARNGKLTRPKCA